MPGMSQVHSKQSSNETAEPTTQFVEPNMGNMAAQDAMQQGDTSPESGGVLALCMASQAADASGCLDEGLTTGASMHGWIALEPEGGARESYGHWPDPNSTLGKATGGLAAVVAVSGKVKTPDPKDSKGPDVSQRFDLTGDQVADLRKWIGSNSSWIYSFTGRNCVDWANAACKAAGQSPTIPDIPGPDLIACPSQSMKWIKGQNWKDGVPQAGEQADPKLRGEAEFEHLTVAEKKSWAKLGYNASNWESGNPAVDEKGWDELTKTERSGASEVGYYQSTWDAE